MTRVLGCLAGVGLMFAGQFVFAAGTQTWIDDFSVPGPVADRYHLAWQDVRVSSGRYFSPDEG